MALTIAVLVFGGVLGLWFAVLILVPATGLTALVVGLVGLVSGRGAGLTLLAVAEAALALQIGYFGGAIISVARLKLFPEMQRSTNLRV